MDIEVQTIIKQVTEMKNTQRLATKGGDKYLIGMYNGIEAVLATLEKREPSYLCIPVKEGENDE